MNGCNAIHIIIASLQLSTMIHATQKNAHDL